MLWPFESIRPRPKDGVAARKVVAFSLLTYIERQCINAEGMVMFSKQLVAASGLWKDRYV